MQNSRLIVRGVGSLWFAAVLLVLLLVAMACATVFESQRGTEQALAMFYGSWWFEAILCLIAINVVASVVVRYPFAKRHIGFVMTHTSILVIFLGALVTKHVGVDGTVGFVEGQTVEDFTVRQDALTLARRGDHAESTVDLADAAFGGFRVVEHPAAPVPSLGESRVEVLRYLPDSVRSSEVVDDNPHRRVAIEVSFSASGTDDPAWVFADHPVGVDGTRVVFRVLASEAELVRLVSAKTVPQDASKGYVKIEYQGGAYDVPLEDCMDEPAALGETGYTVRVLRYLPHATVGADNKITNASDRPVNPAVEAEIVGPEGSETRLAFARFPNFQSMHGKPQIEGLKFTFVIQVDDAPTAPIEVISGPAGTTYVRFCRDGGDVVSRRLNLNEVVETPWPGRRFSLLRRFDHARTRVSVLPVEPVRKERVPAILVRLATEEDSNEMWLQKHSPRPVTIDGELYDLVYGEKRLPLGFSVTLDRFTVGYYPGTQRPRSFESQITIRDPASGRTQSRIVSMNNPTKYGGYTFYQSSYSTEGGRTASYLSVSRDPGQPVVFAGYILMMGGMLVVLVTRMREQRRTTGTTSPGDERRMPVSRPVQLSVPHHGPQIHGDRQPEEDRPVIASGPPLQR